MGHSFKNMAALYSLAEEEFPKTVNQKNRDKHVGMCKGGCACGHFNEHRALLEGSQELQQRDGDG